MLRRAEEGAPTWGKNKRTYAGDICLPQWAGEVLPTGGLVTQGNRRMEARFLSVAEGLINTDKNKKRNSLVLDRNWTHQHKHTGFQYVGLDLEINRGVH